jgi:hypothetical protein
MGIADRLLHPFADVAGRRADERARAAEGERAVRAAASEREIAAHTAALAREIEVYALLVARSERVPERDAQVPARAPRAARALKSARRDHGEFRAAWEGLDAARDAVRARRTDPGTPDAAREAAGRRFRPLEARHPDAAAMRRRDGAWRARIGDLER